MLDSRKDTEVVNVRLENIKLKNKLKKQEAQLKSKVCLLSVIFYSSCVRSSLEDRASGRLAADGLDMLNVNVMFGDPCNSNTAILWAVFVRGVGSLRLHEMIHPPGEVQ